MKSRKILVKAYTATNLGDDLFLKILLERYPQAQFTLIGEKTDGIYGKFNSYVLLSPFVHFVRRVLLIFSRAISEKFTNKVVLNRLEKSSRDYDASLLLGGSMFIQNHSGFTENDTTKIGLLSYNHSFVVGANFGPFIDGEYLTTYKKVFSNCDGITLRDSYSYELLGRMPNSRFCPDVVFQLKHAKKTPTPNTVGISLIDLSRGVDLAYKQKEYIVFLISLVETLITQGKKVYLYSFCKQEGDDDIISHMVDVLGRDKIEIVSYNGNIDDFLDTYSSMECMFCSRFHAMILSLVYSQKMVPIIYSKKMTQVLDDLGYTGGVININSIGDYSAKQAIEMLCSYNYDLPESITLKSEEMFIYLDQFIKQ